MRKYLLIAIILCIGLIAVYSSYYHIEVERPIQSENGTTTTTYRPNVFQKDTISEAQEKINKALAELDKEEERLLSEISDREDELERIRQVRLSFISTPKQSQ